jgi:hypothetical protein
MAYDISTSKKGANSVWLAERHGIKQMAAWLFRRKVQQAMKNSEQFPLEQEVHVDEFEIRSPQKGEPGRSKSEHKVRVVIALEYRDGKAGRGSGQSGLNIHDFSSKFIIKGSLDTHSIDAHPFCFSFINNVQTYFSKK